MAGTGLFALYKLHLIDAALYELKQHAAVLDIGRSETARIKQLESDPEGVLSASRTLSAELKDLELEQKTYDDKLKKLDSDLYGGKVVNPREVANIEKEKENIHELRAKNDERILELWDLVPPAKEAAKSIEDQISSLKSAVAKKQVAAKAEHEQMQIRYKATAAKRPELVKAVPVPLLSIYDKLREKLGVGMAMVTNDHRCGACGMHVPEKAFTMIIEDKVTQCENCRRILFRLDQG